jgi:hypothetical protein
MPRWQSKPETRGGVARGWNKTSLFLGANNEDRSCKVAFYPAERDQRAATSLRLATRRLLPRQFPSPPLSPAAPYSLIPATTLRPRTPGRTRTWPLRAGLRHFINVRQHPSRLRSILPLPSCFTLLPYSPAFVASRWPFVLEAKAEPRISMHTKLFTTGFFHTPP